MGRQVGFRRQFPDPGDGIPEQGDIGFGIAVPRTEGAQVDVEAQEDLFLGNPEAVVVVQVPRVYRATKLSEPEEISCSCPKVPVAVKSLNPVRAG